MTAYEIEHYLTPGAYKDSYIDWLKGLRDTQAKVADIARAVDYWQDWQRRTDGEK